MGGEGRGEENDRKFLPISVFMNFLIWIMVEINLLQQLDSTGIPLKCENMIQFENIIISHYFNI